MPPLKPTRSTSRRGGLPNASRRAPEPPPLDEREGLTELPSDLSELAVILESAMAGGAPAFNETSDAGAERSRPAVQHAELRPQISGDGTPPAVATPDVIGVEAMPDARANPAAPSGMASEREAIAFDEVARSLAAAEACVPLLAQATGLMRLAALDVVKAETARAGGLLQLLRFLRGDISLPVTAVSTAAVIQRIAQAAEAERRLRGIALVTRSSVADATCAGDETLLTNTVLALLLITFGLIEGVQNARVTLSVTVNDTNDIGLAVSQDHVPTPASWTAETGSGELPGDAARVIPAIALKAAHRLAGEWRGRFALATGEHASILTLWLPMIQPAATETLPS